MAAKQDLSQQTVDAAKELAPWKTGMPWWVTLIEGIVLGVIGLLVVIDPQGANVNLGLLLSAGLALAGLLQLWGVMRGKVPESIDSLVAARAAIALFAGLLVLILYFMAGQELTPRGGLTIFGLGSLTFGLLAFAQVVQMDGSARRQALVEFLLFTAFGALMVWTLFAGASFLTTAVTIIGWIALLGGIALVILAIWRQQKGDEADAMIEATTSKVSGTAAAVTSLGRSVDETAASVARDVAEATGPDGDR